MNSRLADPSGATSRPSGSSGWLVLVGSSPYPVSFDQNPASRYGSEQSKVMDLIRTVIQWLLAKEAHPRSRCQHTDGGNETVPEQATITTDVAYPEMTLNPPTATSAVGTRGLGPRVNTAALGEGAQTAPTRQGRLVRVRGFGPGIHQCGTRTNNRNHRRGGPGVRTPGIHQCGTRTNNRNHRRGGPGVRTPGIYQSLGKPAQGRRTA